MIIFNNVYKDYGPTNQALNNIDLRINEGELVFFVGGHGAGKTTLLKLLTGLEKPNKGQINVRSRTLSAISYHGLALARREMGIVMDEFDLFADLTVHENIELPLYIIGKSKKDRDQHINHIIDQMAITNKKNYLASELSWQENKIARICRAFVMEQGLIIADELWEMLEPQFAEKVIQKIVELQELGSVTIVITAQNKKIADDFPKKKRIITLSNGKIISDETEKGRTDKLEGILDNV